MTTINNEALLGRTPPSNAEAERAVLGAMLQSAQAVDSAFESLSTEDFYIPENQQIFEAMKRVQASGNPVDLRTVGNDMLARFPNDFGGKSIAKELLLLVRDVPYTANVRSYIEIVREKSTLRKLIDAGNQIIQQSYTQTDTLADILHNAERLIFDIVMQRSGGEALKPLSTVLTSTFDQIEEMSHLHGRIGGVPTGLYDLDRMTTGLHSGEMIVLGARPSMGKTALALGIATFAAIKGHRNVALFSLEMPAEQIAMRMLCSEANVKMEDLRTGNVSDREWRRIADALSVLSRCRLYIDDTSGLKPSQLRSRCRRLAMNSKLDLVLVDYLGMMGSDGKHDNRQLEVSEISRRLKEIAMELKVPLVVCAQLSRDAKSRKDKTPILSDLRDSGSIEQDADVVIFPHRQSYKQGQDAEAGQVIDDSTAKLIIAKQRNGPTGDVEIEWQADFARYVNPPNTLVAEYANL